MSRNAHATTDQSNSLSSDRLLFIYNADSGFLNMLKHWTHKIVSPSTYDCQLCALTYGNTGVRQKWHAFISNLPFDTVFLHRDEFIAQYPHLKDTLLPCSFLEAKQDKSMKIIVDAETINKQHTLDQLIDICNRAIKTCTDH